MEEDIDEDRLTGMVFFFHDLHKQLGATENARQAQHSGPAHETPIPE